MKKYLFIPIILILAVIIFFLLNSNSESQNLVFPESLCADKNIASVHICGNYFMSLSLVTGGGTTFYDGEENEIRCPGVAPNYLSDECKNLLEIPCEELCSKCEIGSRESETCVEVYEPVCGFPEKQTYSNSCFACGHKEVEYYIKGECK